MTKNRASSHYDDFGFQEIDNASKPISQQIQSFPDHFFGSRVSRGGGLPNHLAGHGIRISVGQIAKHRLRVIRVSASSLAKTSGRLQRRRDQDGSSHTYSSSSN